MSLAQQLLGFDIGADHAAAVMAEVAECSHSLCILVSSGVALFSNA